MNQTICLITCLIICSSCAKRISQPMPPTGPNTIDAGEKALGWDLLFDGTSLDQWRSYGYEDVQGWTVKDGELITSGGQSESIDLMTKEEFQNFELRLEWKLPAKGNSGIMFNVKEVEGQAPWMTGPEYQLIDDDGYDPPLETWQRAGANYAMHEPAVAAAFPTGRYNSTRLIVEDGYVQHWLNDRLVVKYYLWDDDWEKRKNAGKWKDYPDYGIHKSGHIVLQDHDSPVSFRNIKIRRL